MNFLNSLLIGSDEWSRGPCAAGPLDKVDRAKWEAEGLGSKQRTHKKGLGSNSGQDHLRAGRMRNAFCPRKLIWRPLQVMG